MKALNEGMYNEGRKRKGRREKEVKKSMKKSEKKRKKLRKSANLSQKDCASYSRSPARV
jgi:hypothetical protein